MQTVVGLFDRFEDAEKAVRELRDAGFRAENINLVARDTEGKFTREVDARDEESGGAEGAAKGAGIGAALGGIGGLLVGLGALAIPGIGPVVAAGPIISTLAGAGIGAVSGGLIGALVDWGVPREHAETYAEGIRRGGTLVIIRTEERHGSLAAGILNRHNPVDIERKAEEWRQGEDWKEYDPDARPAEAVEDFEEERVYNAQEEAVPVTGSDRDAPIPVVEEEMKIQHRQVDKGGVNVSSHISEEPLEKEVDLRREHYYQERRPADRDATEQDLTAFEEGVMEFNEIIEEPVIEKKARVTEEVRVIKKIDHERQTLRETLRTQQVEVEHFAGDERRSDDPDYQQHFDVTYRDRGQNRSFDYYLPAYHFGRDLANDRRYASHDWAHLEQIARREWVTRSERASWDEIKGAVRYAWQLRK
jgi:uncharacterized protein (TIGR02271 family)